MARTIRCDLCGNESHPYFVSQCRAPGCETEACIRCMEEHGDQTQSFPVCLPCDQGARSDAC